MVVDSKKTKLTEDQILSIVAKETKSEYSPDMVVAFFKKEAKTPGFKSFRYGNTIYAVQPSRTKNNYGVFRALNADTPDNYLASGYEFVKDAYKAGFDTLVTEFTDPSILNIFKTISKKPPNKGMGYRAFQLEDNSYQVILQLGTKREGI